MTGSGAVDLRLAPLVEQARTARVALGAWLDTATTFDEVTVQRLRLAVTEIFTNAVRAQQERGHEDPVLMRIEGDEAAVRVRIEDCGGGFDPMPPEPGGPGGGVGLALARAMTDELTIEPRPGGSRVTLVVHGGEAP